MLRFVFSFVIAAAAAAAPLTVTVNPATVAGSDKKVIRTIVVNAGPTEDLSGLSETDFGLMQVGTTNAQAEVSVITANCSRRSCTLQVAVDGDFGGKVDLHVAARGKSAEVKILTPAEAQSAAAQATAGHAVARANNADKTATAADKKAVNAHTTAKDAAKDAAAASKAVKRLSDRFEAHIKTSREVVDELQARLEGGMVITGFERDGKTPIYRQVEGVESRTTREEVQAMIDSSLKPVTRRIEAVAAVANEAKAEAKAARLDHADLVRRLQNRRVGPLGGRVLKQ